MCWGLQFEYYSIQHVTNDIISNYRAKWRLNLLNVVHCYLFRNESKIVRRRIHDLIWSRKKAPWLFFKQIKIKLCSKFPQMKRCNKILQFCSKSVIFFFLPVTWKDAALRPSPNPENQLSISNVINKPIIHK